ncbi:MAG: hypothetical protein JST91_09025 [Actinobacteria bacterium]|nr:hypothetical protein [Actinomycetota bacterium]
MTCSQQWTQQMRAETVRVLDGLNDKTKAQQAFLNSCSDAIWISDDERKEIRWLLAALIDHRRRVRITVRLWRTLGPEESVDRALAAETSDLLDEHRHFGPFIAQWRAVVTARTRVERREFWRSMMEIAELNLVDDHPTEQIEAPSR